ncbi:hypothetical protein PHLCEN_2v13580 [Hermanssonia centrifuga]|uniref:Uncharacterized protein n=1 Tax=Hermanssonia centrifuga TaxID=98765 RepID=A0A2R6NDY3_9APHY|nr:hypothetical protein PHLCEN_2v13580 [Hermanssonia centrifuga]
MDRHYRRPLVPRDIRIPMGYTLFMRVIFNAHNPICSLPFGLTSRTHVPVETTTADHVGSESLGIRVVWTM